MRRALALLLIPSVALGGVDPFADNDGAVVELGAVELEDWLELPVTSVSLQEERSSQAPAAVFVLSGDDLRDQGFRTLAEVLRAVPGLFIASDTAYLNIGVRGLSLPGDQVSRFLVMLDGQPVNNAVGIGQSYVDRELPVGVQAIERVEVIQGPIGGVYGPNAFMGAVNFVTKRGVKPSADVMLAGEVNSVGPSAGELAATFSGRLLDRIDVLAHAGGFTSKGGTFSYPEWSLFSDRTGPAGGRVRAGWENAGNFYVRLGWEGFALSAGYAQKRKNISSFPYGSIIEDPTLFYENSHLFTSLSWEKQVGLVAMLFRAGYQEARYDDDLGFGVPQTHRFVDHAFDRWLSAEARASFSPTPWFRAVAGGLAQHHWTRQQYGYSTEPLTDLPVGFSTLNLYGLLELRPFGDRLLLQGGANYTWHRLYGTQLTPRLAAVASVTDRVTAKLFLSGGFRNPTLFEGFYDDGVAFIPSEGLTGDSSLSIEASLNVKLARWANVGVTLFDTSYDRLITQVSSLDEEQDGLPGPGASDVTSGYTNLPSFQVHGAQLFADVRHPRVRVFGGISLQDTRSPTGLLLPGFAHFTGNLSASTNFPWRPLTVAFSGVLIGPRLKPNPGLVPGATAEVPWGGSFQVTVRLQLPWVKGLSVMFSLQNILSQTLRHPVQGDYAPITSAPEPELLGRFQLEWRY